MQRKLNCYIVLTVFTFVFLSCSSENQTIYNLSVTVDDPKSGTVTPSQGKFETGSLIKLTAIPNEHWYFEGWRGDYNEDNNPAIITMDSDKMIFAQFIIKKYPLHVTIKGNGTVTEQIIHHKISEYPHGTIVELTPIPKENWKFVRWEGDASGSDNPLQLTVQEQAQIIAVFEYDSNLTRILTNESENGIYSNDKIEGIVGIEVIDNVLRLYYRKGRFVGVYFIETSDLDNWSDHIEVTLPREWHVLNRIGIFYHNC